MITLVPAGAILGMRSDLRFLQAIQQPTYQAENKVDHSTDHWQCSCVSMYTHYSIYCRAYGLLVENNYFYLVCNHGLLKAWAS